MKRLDRLVLAEVVPPFFLGLLLFIGLFMGADNLIKLVDWAGKGVPPTTLLTFFLVSLPPVLALTSPIAMLLAVLLGFGRLSDDSELTAVAAAGTPIERVILPVAVFAFVVGCAGVYINDTVVPASEYKRQAIINDLKQKAGQSFGGTDFSAKYRDNAGRVAVRVDADGQLETIGGGRFRINNVTITRYTDGVPTETTFAATAEGNPDSVEWTLFGVRGFGQDASGQTYSFGGKALDGKKTEIATPESLLAASRPNIELTTRQLREKAETLRAGGSASDARGVEVEAARRLMVPIGTLIFALVGAPLGITPNRASKGLGFGYSVGIAFLYWIALQLASVMGLNGVLPPMLAVALPNIAGIVLGIYLIGRVRR